MFWYHNFLARWEKQCCENEKQIVFLKQGSIDSNLFIYLIFTQVKLLTYIYHKIIFHIFFFSEQFSYITSISMCYLLKLLVLPFLCSTYINQNKFLKRNCFVFITNHVNKHLEGALQQLMSKILSCTLRTIANKPEKEYTLYAKFIKKNSFATIYQRFC